MSGASKKLILAKEKKDNEFYTLYEDIEKEIPFYKGHLKGKIIYMPCDNPELSNFWKFFKNNFKELELKKIIATHISLNGEKVFKTEFSGNKEIKRELKGNGGFETQECRNIMSKCDIIITNPPFSLFDNFINQIMEFNKNFLIIGHLTVLDRVYLFEKFKNKEIFTGNNRLNNFVNNNNEIKQVAALWYTNMPHETIKTSKIKTSKKNIEYTKYDNYDSIEVPKLELLRYYKEYEGNMGVPITFFIKHYDIDKYEVIDLIKPKLNGKDMFLRIIIKNKFK